MDEFFTVAHFYIDRFGHSLFMYLLHQLYSKWPGFLWCMDGGWTLLLSSSSSLRIYTIQTGYQRAWDLGRSATQRQELTYNYSVQEGR